MTTVLIVDDSVVDRKLAGGCLKNCDLEVAFACDGREALELMADEPPDLVVTDLQMPEVDGLELVKQMRTLHRRIPVILMTAHGNEEIAVTALKLGASSYVPKKNLSRDLKDTVLSILSIASSERAEQLILESLTSVRMEFTLGNDIAALRPLILIMQGHMRQLAVCEESDLVRISTALQEALINAIEHGNLELDSALRELKDNTYQDLGEKRRQQQPYASRKTFVTAEFNQQGCRWTIRDEGRGFDPDSLPDPRDPANLQRVSGRGLLLIRTFMDETSFNDSGSEITMFRKRSQD
ncbi:MAG: response regulator [Planctomycetota bacterium]|nr:response regulator [Planctomycetota bacterium]MDA1164851.1 response regulator [Planctomycetota bacterium]